MRVVLFVVIAAAATQAAAQPCGGLEGAQTVESPGYVLAYRADPAAVEIGRHFGVDIAVCPKPGVPAPDEVHVDGYMPEHRHGMNYRAVVKRAPGGHYRADGLMFHMPGRWDFIFELRGGGRTERLTHGIVLQ